MRPWDSYDVYLFDIDGTLLHCKDAVHYFGFCEVLTAAAGQPMNLDGVVAHGNVDVGIIRDAMQRAGIADSQWRPDLPQMRKSLATFVERHQAEFCIDLLPGVREVLQHLRSRGALLGVATGNLERIGWAKLRGCGLDNSFDFGGFSDQCEDRADVIRGAVHDARQRAGANATICVVGDTPKDVRAARTNGVDVIAVATGIYSREELAAESPDLLLQSMLELTRLGKPRLLM